MGALTVQIDGLVDLDAALGELKKATASNTLYRSLDPAAQLVDEAWRARAPRDKGHLAHSGGIVKTSRLIFNQAYGRAFGQTADQAAAVKAGKLALTASADERSFAQYSVGPGRNPQSIFQEFGTRFQVAQPYMRPAWDATKDQALQLILSNLKTQVDAAVARAQARAARVAAKIKSAA